MSSWRGHTWQRRWRKFFAKEERPSGFKFCPKFWRTWIRDLKDSAAEILSILENIYILLDIMWQIITYVKCLCIFSNLKMHQVGWMEPPNGLVLTRRPFVWQPLFRRMCSFISGRMLGPITVCVCVCERDALIHVGQLAFTETSGTCHNTHLWEFFIDVSCPDQPTHQVLPRPLVRAGAEHQEGHVGV